MASSGVSQRISWTSVGLGTGVADVSSASQPQSVRGGSPNRCCQTQRTGTTSTFSSSRISRITASAWLSPASIHPPGKQTRSGRRQSHCPQCDRLVTARAPVPRTVETMVGPVPLERPYFYCRTCHCGVYPLDEILGLTAGRTQLDVQKAVAKLVTEVPYDEAHTLFRDLTGLAGVYGESEFKSL